MPSKKKTRQSQAARTVAEDQATMEGQHQGCDPGHCEAAEHDEGVLVDQDTWLPGLTPGFTSKVRRTKCKDSKGTETCL
jgi:hypothetical protein